MDPHIDSNFGALKMIISLYGKDDFQIRLFFSSILINLWLLSLIPIIETKFYFHLIKFLAILGGKVSQNLDSIRGMHIDLK